MKLKKKITISLLIIGEGKNKKIIKEFIINNNLEKIVKLKDYTKNPFPYIKQADLLILTSKFEGLPNVLLEAITLKKFVISSNCKTGPKEILDNGKGGLLFKTGNYKDLSNKILFYNKNKNICNHKLKFSKSRLKRFSYKKNLNKYYKIIKNMM